MIIFSSFLFLLLIFSLYSSMEYDEESKNSIISSDYPRIIWSYYVGAMPPYIREMLDTTVNSLNNTWTYYFLTDENISDYLDTSSFPPHFSLLLPQHQSDIIRLTLLQKYGGWWMDNGIIVNNNSEIERIYERVIESRVDFYATCVYECPLKDVETCFMYAKKGSVIITKWLHEMNEVYKIGEENYIYKVYREGVNVPRITFIDYPKVNPYMVIFAAFEKVKFRETDRNLPIIIEPADDVLYTMHRYVYEKGKTFKEVYFNKELRKQFPIIKLGGWVRVQIFPEKVVTGFESFEPFPLEKGRKGGFQIGFKMIRYLLNYFLLYFLFSILIHKTFLKGVINK